LAFVSAVVAIFWLNIPHRVARAQPVAVAAE